MKMVGATIPGRTTYPWLLLGNYAVVRGGRQTDIAIVADKLDQPMPDMRGRPMMLVLAHGRTPYLWPTPDAVYPIGSKDE